MEMAKSLKDPRKAFAEAMVELGKKSPDVLAVSCDSASGGGLSPFI
jgi:transketolase